MVPPLYVAYLERLRRERAPAAVPPEAARPLPEPARAGPAPLDPRFDTMRLPRVFLFGRVCGVA